MKNVVNAKLYQERTEKIENFATFLNTKSFVTVVTIFVMEHNLNISGANI